MPIRLHNANSIVVKTLKPVLFPYRGGVPLKIKKRTLAVIPIVKTYHLSLVSTPVSFH
jgi:hypothetical protein